MPNPYIIVISCVTTETVMVSSPSIFYKADEVHLFRYIRDPGTASAKLYEDHFQSVCKQIRSSLPECLVTEHTDDPVYDLPRMVRALSVLYSRIRKEHPDAEVHANLSSGPSEFIAALGIFAFLNPDVKLFKVATKRYTVGAEEFMLLHYDEDGSAVGLSREVYDPGPVPTVTLDGPDEVLVRSLRLYHQVLERGESPTGPLMMSLLEEKGLWIQSRNHCGKKTSESTLDRNNYYRNYANIWKMLGWIEDRDMRECPPLTEEGKAVIEMFWPE